VTQEFDISVTPVGQDEYLVRTERVAPGVPLAEEQVRWPIEKWLVQARQLMNDPLMGLLQGHAPASTLRDRSGLSSTVSLPNGVSSSVGLPDSHPSFSLVELGQQLYSALFQGTLRDSWVTAQGIAQHRNETLRLRLGLKGQQVLRLPWEVLYANDTPAERQPGSVGAASRPLTAGTHVIFSRYQPNVRLAVESLISTPEPNQPLRVLMVIAAPTDRERLKLEQEATRLQQELQNQVAPTPDAVATPLPDVQLTILKQPGREQLTQALEQGRYQILHYAGHSDLGANGGSLYLVNPRTGLTEILTGNDLAGLLVNNGIRLAVFNSCRGAYTAASNSNQPQERNLAETLVSRGIPAVLAMAEQIPDNVALTLTWLFYRNLKLGYPIDLSLSRARQGLISAYSSHQLYWALPVLYLHPEFDGYVIPIQPVANPAERLVLLPQLYGAFSLTGAEDGMPTSRPVWPARSPYDTVQPSLTSTHQASDWTNDTADLEQTYEEDASLVAELLQQLSSSDAALPGSTASPLAPVAMPVAKPTSAPVVNPVMQQDKPPTAVIAERQPEAAPLAVATPTAVESNQTEPFSARRRLLKPVVGTLSAAAVVAIGIWSYSQIQSGGLGLQFPDNSSLPIVGSLNLQTADSEAVKTFAINHFRRQQYAEGEAAVTALLDRGELQAAAEALAAVPTSVDTPEINYLWGRLSWQGIDTGSPVHTLADARRYWELAANAAPDNPKYQEALGFAYYAENQPLRAMQTWNRALNTLEQAPAVTLAAADTSSANMVAAEETALQERLTVYAGIALALWDASIGQSPAQQENLIRKAARLYQMVQQQDPNNFRADVLQRNWLWKDATVRDWQALSRIQP
jgi:tetratricopeptide (TPR) repeat protein